MAPERTRDKHPVQEAPGANGLDFRDFLMRACHDLRTPLRSIRTNAELLLTVPQKRQGPDFEQILGFIAEGARKSDSVVDGLSNYSLALHIQPDTFQPVKTDLLLRTAMAKLAADLRSSRAEIDYDELPRVPGDPDRLLQVFENLLRNAILHRGPAAPRVHVSAQQREGAWLFAFCDNGPGVDSQDLERIFRPFERLNGTAGVGLGLAICREIVTRHGGKIWAESTPGAGCTFFFTLPAGS